MKLPNRASWLEWIAERIGLYYHGQLEHDTLWSVGEARAAVARHGFRVLDVRLANMLPLTLDHPLAQRLTGPIWTFNRLLARIPLLRRLATNVEVDALRNR